MIEILTLSTLLSFAVTYIATKKLIDWEKKIGMVSRDQHKRSKRMVAHTAGPSVIFGVLVGIMLIVGYSSFFGVSIELEEVFAGTITLIVVSYIGLVDDLFVLEQYWKPIMPLLAAIPLMAINAGNPNITLPFIGTLNVGILYPLFLVPLGITVASNVTNMLAGFNGLEAGMGIVLFLTISIVALMSSNLEMSLFSLPLLGALGAFFIFNKYPAKIFPGDSTNYLIGAGAAVSLIVGNHESLGAILFIPYGVDAILKALSGFPKTFVRVDEKNLLSPPEKTRGLVDLVLKIRKMDERSLVQFFIAIEALLGAIALYITFFP